LRVSLEETKTPPQKYKTTQPTFKIGAHPYKVYERDGSEKTCFFSVEAFGRMTYLCMLFPKKGDKATTLGILFSIKSVIQGMLPNSTRE